MIVVMAIPVPVAVLKVSDQIVPTVCRDCANHVRFSVNDIDDRRIALV